MAKYSVEHTDTFGGEPNYCWVNRHTFETKGDAARLENRAVRQRILVTMAKAMCGLTGHRCEVSDLGDTLEIRPRGLCQVVFVSYADE